MKAQFSNIAWLIAGGLIVFGYQTMTEKKSQKASAAEVSVGQRKQSLEAAIAAGPKARTWELSQGTVVEILIPLTKYGGDWLETKRCYVWRDASTKTSSMACDPDEMNLN